MAKSKDRIGEFLHNYPNKHTASTYSTAIYDFLDSVYGKTRKKVKVSDKEKLKYEELSAQYFKENRDRFKDVLAFVVLQHNKPPIGARAKIAGVKEFLAYHNVEFTALQLKQLSKKAPKGNHARTAEKEIDTVILKKILAHMDVKGRALVLFLASSGVRIGEAMQIKLEDIDLEKTPPEVVVRGETAKGGDTRTVFFSDEAKEALIEWLKVRKRYLISAKDKNRGLVDKVNCNTKSMDDDRVFPFSERTTRAMWNNALSKTGLFQKDSSTGRSQIRIHALRKFFRSQLALSCPLDIVEALMGHEGYLTEAYRRYTTKQMGEYYLKGEHQITVTGTGDIREISDRVRDQQETINGYRNTIHAQEGEIAELSRRLGTLEAAINEFSLMVAYLTEKSKDVFDLNEYEFYKEHKRLPQPLPDIEDIEIEIVGEKPKTV